MTSVRDLIIVGNRTCALLPRDEVFCWGWSLRDEPPPGRTGTRGLRQVAELPGAVALTGTYEFFCARHEGGAVSCVGSNREGELGGGRMPESDFAPGEPGAVLVEF